MEYSSYDDISYLTHIGKEIYNSKLYPSQEDKIIDLEQVARVIIFETHEITEEDYIIFKENMYEVARQVLYDDYGIDENVSDYFDHINNEIIESYNDIIQTLVYSDRKLMIKIYDEIKIIKRK